MSLTKRHQRILGEVLLFVAILHTKGVFTRCESDCDCNKIASRLKGYLHLRLHFYHPREGYVFTAVCDSVHMGGLSQCMLGYHIPSPRSREPSWSRHLPLGSRHPSPEQTHTPWSSTRREIRPTRGRHASPRNAILFFDLSRPFLENANI